MKLQRTKNAVKNSIWGMLSRMISLLLPFFVRSALIYTIGIEYLGLSSLFSSILSILNLSELGVGSAIVFSMYKLVVEEDEKQLCALMNLYKQVYRVIGIVIGIVGTCLIPFLPHLVKGNVPADINLYILYLIYLIDTVVSYWLFAYRSSILYAHQRNDIISKTSIITSLFLRGVQIAVLFLARNYYVYIILQPMFSLIVNVLNAYWSKKLYPNIVCAGSVDKKDRKDISKRVMGLMVDNLAYASRNSFDSIIVSMYLGLQMVAMYNNYYLLITSVSGVMRIVMASMAAGIGNSLVIESTKKNENDMRCINFIYLAGAGLSFCCFLGLYQPFVRIWVGEQYMFSEMIMVSFSLYFLVEKVEHVLGKYYDAAGLWWKGKWKGVIEAGTNLLLNIVLCKYFGVIGVVFATLISMVLVGAPMTAYYLYKHYYKKSCLRYLGYQASLIARYCIVGYLAYKLCAMVPYGSDKFMAYLLMGCRLVICVACFAVSFFALFWKDKQCRASAKWLKVHVKILRGVPIP